MNVLFFDTETNGLPLSKHALTSNIENWPRIVQIAWQLLEFAADGTGFPIERGAYIIKPEESLVWNEESARIHGISKERALSEGCLPHTVLKAFMSAAQKATVLVAHNIAFDKPVLKAEYLRLNNAEGFSWWPSHEYCTCENTKMLCKLPSKYSKAWDPYKLPKLIELHKYLYGEEMMFEFHNAVGDVECLVSCFHELVRRRVVPLDRWLRDARRVLAETD